MVPHRLNRHIIKYISSGNRNILRLYVILYNVPASLIYEFDGFRNKMGKIYEGKNLHW
jgi:hypothetical protein